jgi:hypothetical protein
MAEVKLEQKPLTINFDTTELNPQQIRLIKSICSMLGHVLTTDDECDYFDGSADLMKLVAGVIKQANFSTEWNKDTDIPYADQALEFCMDMVSDQLQGTTFLRHDN